MNDKSLKEIYNFLKKKKKVLNREDIRKFLIFLFPYKEREIIYETIKKETKDTYTYEDFKEFWIKKIEKPEEDVINKIFYILDRDSDGYISYEDLRINFLYLGFSVDKTILTKLFSIFPTEKKSINLSEFRNIIMK
ncbi:hypothetical protein CWI38_1489p0020 [Hamiltosporidium tvaerminnensis]|uniref:EF-hand domain-containing protein n=1 Tax=Hamiltosporidium tvaerminnensis TaxID=1176355 RepID=A0A4Q9LQR5_9MICR|nr:hypothetical protein CWI38_1532p0010 [Hamiltosporidium tvaerminnensis]TBU10894.1 hypothetical protein CWI38_1489p0020 [Hamiltosporidium tvaerminnensis]